MKNILLASTALVAFAGAASAEVLLSGQAELGIFNADSIAGTPALTGDDGSVVAGSLQQVDGNTGFFTDLDVTFTMSGETDTGLTFGANIDIDEAGDGANFERPGVQGGETIFISGAFGTLTGGDTDGALDFALTETAFNSGSLNDDETLHAGFNGNVGLDGLYDGQIIRYDYSVGDLGLAFSMELDDGNGDGNDDIYGLGAKYQIDLGGYNIGLGGGYQFGQVADVSLDTWGLSANTEIAGFAVGISYMHFKNHVPSSIADGGFTGARGDQVGDSANTAQGNRILTDGDDTDHFGIGVGYTSGAISASLNYGQYDSDAIGDIQGIGLSAGYDLGGGAILQVGYGYSDYSDVDFSDGTDDLDDVNAYSLGIRMNF